MARLDQEKRVQRIREGLENKRAAEPEWKPAGKGRNQAKWDKVADLLKRNGNTVDEVAKIADVGIATVYRIKKDADSVKPHQHVISRVRAISRTVIF